ncbi:MAG: ATP synthase F1 subunit gamma [Oscillospiraceae bacterium]|nr:ATP synthase F1 subunit gamma [Oscillospiraceae bacterium]
MPSTKEIKARMSGVRETKQITSAMYLVASTKLRHAREDLEKTRPYFDALRTEIRKVFRADDRTTSRYFLDEDGTLPDKGVCGILAVTGDKGLAGAYNMNVLRRVEALLKEHEGARLFVIGEYGRRYFHTHRIPYEEDFLYTAQQPSQDISREICTRLLALYESAALNELVVVYTDMRSSMSAEVQTQRLLPLDREQFSGGEMEKAGEARFEFFPSQEAVVGAVMRSYLSGFIYSAVVDSLCSEQNARVTAMEAANRNAEELLADLSLQLNRERQSAITQEITEISAGAQAQKRSKS